MRGQFNLGVVHEVIGVGGVVGAGMHLPGSMHTSSRLHSMYPHWIYAGLVVGVIDVGEAVDTETHPPSMHISPALHFI